MGYTPHVVVIGGGSTGTGVARDLAMRGLDVTLLERGTLASGTSGAMHAVLHSGARYAVDDPEVAAACRRENRILRDIAAPCVSDTGGVFVSLPADPPGYVERAMAACEDAGIETIPLDAAGLRDHEPTLASTVTSGFTVPDAVIDPFRLCVATARSAHRFGADIRTHAAVVDIDVEGGAVSSLLVRSRDPGQETESTSTLTSIEPDYVVNAAGPAAAQVADLAGVSVPMQPAQGAMVAVDRSELKTVVNRCRPRTEGDIAVPFGSTAVLGTTDRTIEDSDAVEPNPDAVDFVLDEVGALVPRLRDARPFRAYWGVRALSPADGGERVTRHWSLHDHEARDDIWGLVTVFGGKLTIHRQIAKAVADHVCDQFGIDRPCRTAEFDLPDPIPTTDPSPPNPLLCEDEGVRRATVQAVLDDGELSPDGDLDAVRSRTRAGMGACQGGSCGHRLAAELSPAAPVSVVDRQLESFAAARWRGRRQVLWGDNLADAAMTYRHAESLRRGEADQRGAADPIEWWQFDQGPDAREDEQA